MNSDTSNQHEIESTRDEMQEVPLHSPSPIDCSSIGHEEDSCSERSYHSDRSWEMLSQDALGEEHPAEEAAPPSAPPPAVPSSALVLSPGQSPEHSDTEFHCHLDTAVDAFVYSSSADDTHSDSGTNDVMRRGEIEFGPPSPRSACPFYAAAPQRAPSPSPAPAKSSICVPKGAKKAAAAAATLAVAGRARAGRAVVSLVADLNALALQVRTYTVRRVVDARRLMGCGLAWVASTVRNLARSLQVSPAAKSFKALLPVRTITEVATEVTLAVGRSFCLAGEKARRHAGALSLHNIDWVKAALAVGCAGLLAVLCKVSAENGRLAALLFQREAELATIVARIVDLQRNVSSQRVPIIRHTTGRVYAGVGTWPVYVHAI